MKHGSLHSILLLVCILLLAGSLTAQRISFGTYASDDLVMTELGTGELNFNQKQPVILAGNTVSISLQDEEVAVLMIEGRADLDVTVSFSAPLTLDLDASNQIPLALRFAYSNTGAATDAIAKTTAQEVPAGFVSATFPISQRAAGLPPPPPTPGYVGYTAPTGKAYLFVYGTLGPLAANLSAGLYTGTINIHVEYSKY